MHEAVTPKTNYFSHIESRIKEIIGTERENPVFLQGASYLRNDINGAKVTVNCLFCNGAGEICADLYVELAGGYCEFHTGKSIEKIGNSGLRHILQALQDNRWSMCEI